MFQYLAPCLVRHGGSLIRGQFQGLSDRLRKARTVTDRDEKTRHPMVDQIRSPGPVSQSVEMQTSLLAIASIKALARPS